MAVMVLTAVLMPAPEGGYTALNPETGTTSQGDTVEEALENVQDALAAVVETYQDLGRSLPSSSQILDLSMPLSFETVISAP